MTTKSKYRKIRCSFCGKTSTNVEKMITGPSVHICNECVEMCNEILREDKEKVDTKPMFESIPSPQDIKELLDQHVVKQEQAKKGISVAAYNHFKRIQSRNKTIDDDGTEIEKTNMLMIGASGTGKTLIAQTLARIMQVPFTIVDATIFTEAGYVGEDVENMLVRLLAAADYDTAKAEKGIIYIDEFDKIARKSANPSITRDVSGEGVQQAMLKILEGTVASVPPKGGRKHPEQELTQINTRDILFICGGAFVGLEEIIEARLDQGRMGFNAQLRKNVDRHSYDILQAVEPDDLIHFGIIPELAGRIPSVYAMENLDAEALQKILTQPKHALIKQYKKLFALENVELTFSSGALKEIVERAKSKKTGARGLRNILESVLMPIMFDLPSKKNVTHCHITKDVVSSGRTPTYKYRDNKKIA